ncbi:hypothetical protein G0029_16400 (plasmid) [Acinetobacter sp. YH12138]|uniref:hypothetical protein n=1 Tax=unclassified Acinetobacter TaxID=196816 RepID=UPI0015D43A08|nr:MULTISPECIES: hypothetical protein [unclassified Acinetobacter]QOW51395.1 hypothetical protein G0029_16400 [Acinetobacter sp. YH12138]
MNFLIYILETRPFLLIGMFGLFFFAISLAFYIIFYIYMNVNIKKISKIIFNDENKYSRPLEPFNFLFLSFLPTTYWREIINIKYGSSFKKLYGKESFYYSIDRDQLTELLKTNKGYFILQYTIFTLIALAIICVIVSYVFEKY